MKHIENDGTPISKPMMAINLGALLIAPILLVVNLTLLYHLGDADGNARTTFGAASAALDNYLVTMRPGGATSLVLVSGALLWASLQTTIMSSVLILRENKVRIASISLACGILLTATYVIGFFLVLAT